MIATGPLLTLVMLTHNRPRFMARAIRYYMGMPYQLLVMDSSPESSADLAAQYGNEQVSYQHCPEYAYGAIMQKIRRGVALVQTPYLAFVTDDDFLTLEGLDQSNCIFTAEYGLRYLPWLLPDVSGRWRARALFLA